MSIFWFVKIVSKNLENCVVVARWFMYAMNLNCVNNVVLFLAGANQIALCVDNNSSDKLSFCFSNSQAKF